MKVSKPSQEIFKIIEDTAGENSYHILVEPVEFEITCKSGNKTIEISKFDAYVERMIAIPEGVDPEKVTTGVVLNPDGTFSHVPTEIVAVDGKYYARIKSLTNSIYSVIYSPVEFVDVTNHWAKEAINDMASRLIIGGVGNSRFEPNREITRAEFAAIMTKALGLQLGTGENLFEDVNDTAWYCDFVKTTADYKIISGYGNRKFGPQDKITREQTMTMIARAMQITDLEVNMDIYEAQTLLGAFKDSDQLAEWSKEGMALCIRAGIISGKADHMLGPKDHITRGEVAVIVRRLLKTSDLI